jgi:hypothetical protein
MRALITEANYQLIYYQLSHVVCLKRTRLPAFVPCAIDHNGSMSAGRRLRYFIRPLRRCRAQSHLTGRSSAACIAGAKRIAQASLFRWFRTIRKNSILDVMNRQQMCETARNAQTNEPAERSMEIQIPTLTVVRFAFAGRR